MSTPAFVSIWDYEARSKESVPCNLCGASSWQLVGTDRYGYPLHFTNCDCGLCYIAERMTAEAYSEFYASGAYRRLVAERERQNGREPMSDVKLRLMQATYAVYLANFLRPALEKAPQYTLLDIGGSTGVVARTLGAVFGLVPTVLDPAAHELPEDLCMIPALIEDYDPDGCIWDLVTMCQTVDHLLDIAGTLQKVRSLLSPGGLFFVDILDHNKAREFKIDHPFYLAPPVMERYLRQAGFGIEAIQRAEDPRHVRFLCRRDA